MEPDGERFSDLSGTPEESDVGTEGGQIPETQGPERSRSTDGLWWVVEIAGRTFRQLDLGHPDVGPRIVEEIESGVDVYYNRRWDQTRRFCRYLLAHPGLVEGRRVFVAGAGVGMEAVVVGRLAAALTVNDMAPVALDLQMEQLAENGIRGARRVPGSFGEAPLEDIDLVVACYVVYDQETRAAVASLLDRGAEKGIPALLANADLEGHFSDLLRSLDSGGRAVTELQRDGGRYIVRVG